jgi:hypothetical protein
MKCFMYVLAAVKFIAALALVLGIIAFVLALARGRGFTVAIVYGLLLTLGM